MHARHVVSHRNDPSSWYSWLSWVPLRTYRAPVPALTNAAGRSTSAPRNRLVTGTSNPLASNASVLRLHDVWAFSILDIIALEMPTRAAISATVSACCCRNCRTLRPIAASNSSSSTGSWGSRSRAVPDLLRRSGMSVTGSPSSHLTGTDIRIRTLQQVALVEPRQSEVGMRDPRVAAVSVDDEVGDQPSHRRRDLEPVPAETGRDDETVERGRGDHRVPVRRDVVAPGVATADRRVDEPGEAGADLLDGEVDERVGGAVQVLVGICLLDVGQIAVAEKDVAAHLRPDVLQRHQVGEYWDGARLDARRDRDDLLTHHPDRHVDAVRKPVRLEKGRCPPAARAADGPRRDLAAAGEPDTGDPVVDYKQRGDSGSLADSDACCARRRRDRLRGQICVAVAAARLPPEGLERRQIRERPHSRHLGPVDLLRLHADGPLGGQALTQGFDVGFADADDISGLPEADVGAEDFLGLLEHFQADGGHRGQRRDPVVAADDAAGLAGHPRCDGTAFGHYDIRDASLAERPRGGRALDAAADDDYVCSAHRCPGIQSVPASGTLAIAAASMVTATRSSGSRCSTCALPQARAMVWASMVSTRR